MGTNKDKARELAVGWWQLDLAQRYREKGFVNCSLVSYHEIPVGEGFLCNPMGADDSKPALVCADCFEGYRFDPWDGGQSGVRQGPYSSSEQALAQLEVSTRTVWRLNRDGMGPKPQNEAEKDRGGGVEVPPVYVKPAAPERKVGIYVMGAVLAAGLVVVILVLYLALRHSGPPKAAAATTSGTKTSSSGSGWGDAPLDPQPAPSAPSAGTSPTTAPANDDWGAPTVAPTVPPAAPTPGGEAPAAAPPPAPDPRLADLARTVDERVRQELASHPVSPQQVADKLKLGWPVPQPLATPQEVAAAAVKAADQQVAKQFPTHNFLSEAVQKYRQYRPDDPSHPGETVKLWLKHNRQGTTAEQVSGVLHEVRDEYIKVGDRTIYKADLEDQDRVHFDELRADVMIRDYVKTETARYEQARKDARPAALAEVTPKLYANAGYVQVNNAWVARNEYLRQQVEAAKQAQATDARTRAERDIYGAAGYTQRNGQWVKP